MFLLSAASGNLRVGDMVVQLVFLLILVVLIAGVISLIVRFNKREKRLARMEEKIDQLLSKKDK